MDKLTVNGVLTLMACLALLLISCSEDGVVSPTESPWAYIATFPDTDVREVTCIAEGPGGVMFMGANEYPNTTAIYEYDGANITRAFEAPTRNTDIYDLAFAGNVGYAVGVSDLDSYSTPYILRYDNGSWTEFNNVAAEARGSFYEIYLAGPEHFYCWGHDVVYRYLNGTWDAIFEVDGHDWDIEGLARGDNGNLYVPLISYTDPSAHSLMVSNDNGDNWVKENLGFDSYAVRIHGCDANGNRLHFGVNYDGYGIYVRSNSLPGEGTYIRNDVDKYTTYILFSDSGTGVSLTGDYDYVLYFDGSTWIKEPLPDDAQYHNVTGLGEAGGYFWCAGDVAGESDDQYMLYRRAM